MTTRRGIPAKLQPVFGHIRRLTAHGEPLMPHEQHDVFAPLIAAGAIPTPDTTVVGLQRVFRDTLPSGALLHTSVEDLRPSRALQAAHRVPVLGRVAVGIVANRGLTFNDRHAPNQVAVYGLNLLADGDVWVRCVLAPALEDGTPVMDQTMAREIDAAWEPWGMSLAKAPDSAGLVYDPASMPTASTSAELLGAALRSLTALK